MEPVTDQATPVSGELIGAEEATVIPSEAEQNTAADRARGRTAIQAGGGSFVVVLIEYGFALARVDLDPWGEGTGFPGVGNAALVGLITIIAAYRMNPKR